MNLFDTDSLAENVRRYQQLKQMIAYSKSHEDYLRLVNRGLENSMGLLRALPIKDDRLLKELGNAHQISRSVTYLYGSIPKSKEAVIHKLHDRSVSQSIRMASQTMTMQEGRKQMHGFFPCRGAEHLQREPQE